jgi:hypothetical protein
MNAKTILVATIGLFFMICGIGCEEEKTAVRRIDGYVIGYDPCTIQQHSRVGYILVSEDLKDTVMTYNIADAAYKIPASILSQSGDTLYKIPESYFKQFTYFPTTARYDFKVHISYRYPNVNETYSSPCLALYLSGHSYREIIAVSIAK